MNLANPMIKKHTLESIREEPLSVSNFNSEVNSSLQAVKN